MSRTRRSAWNYLSAVGYLAAAPALALVSMPLLLRWLGAERLGAYRAASDWGGYVALLELGVGGALLPILARTLGRGDVDATRAAVVAGFRAYLRVTAWMVAAALALVAVVPWLVPVAP